LSGLGINSFKGFAPDKAKQFVPCSHDGYVIGDVILFYLAENQFNMVGRAPTLNWVLYNAEISGRRVTCTYDERTAARPDPQNRRHYRYQLQGPNALEGHRVGNRSCGAGAQILQYVLDGDRRPQSARTEARHGRQPGFELMDPGRRRRDSRGPGGGRQGSWPHAGGRSLLLLQYPGVGLDTLAPAAVYTGEKMKPYREWLTVNHYEAKASIGGSFVSDKVEDYYLTPWELGYGFFVKFDHDFIGRAALEKMAAGPHRKKVTLASTMCP